MSRLEELGGTEKLKATQHEIFCGGAVQGRDHKPDDAIRCYACREDALIERVEQLERELAASRKSFTKACEANGDKMVQIQSCRKLAEMVIRQRTHGMITNAEIESKARVILKMLETKHD